MPKGYFTFVLHAHMPYVRQAGHWPQGETILHEAIAEAYVPLLNVLYDLRAEGVPFRLTVGVTPILAEQLADAEVLDRAESFLMEQLRRAEEDVRRFEKDGEDSPSHHLLYLARFYAEWYGSVLQSFRERFGRDLIGAFRLLQDEGLIELVTSAATHGYLPLLERDSTIYAQLRTGVTTYLRHFGRLPQGAWLPECGYRPAYFGAGPGRESVKPGLEAFLAELNLHYTFADSHMFGRGPRADRAADGVADPYDELVEEATTTPSADQERVPAARTTLCPYLIRASNVAVYGCDDGTTRQVWPAEEGYPGDFCYREFRRREDLSGLRYWRITGDQVTLAEKNLYDPYHAFHRAQEHAVHFVGSVGRLLGDYHAGSARPGIIVAAYDAELFGHWWFEGIPWLKEVLLRLSRDADVDLTTAGEYLEQFPPEEAIDLPEGSWGRGGDHSTWLNADTAWMWPLIHEAERRMEGLVARFPDAEGDQLEVLKQAARELLLVQSSDWPFLIASGQAAAYATDRFQEHLARFNRLALLAEKDTRDEQDRVFLQECRHLDNPFLNVDYRVFASRENQS